MAPPAVRQVVAKRHFAMLVRGEDRYGRFHLAPGPSAEDAMAWHNRILAARNEATYDGAEA